MKQLSNTQSSVAQGAHSSTVLQRLVRAVHMTTHANARCSRSKGISNPNGADAMLPVRKAASLSLAAAMLMAPLHG